MNENVVLKRIYLPEGQEMKRCPDCGGDCAAMGSEARNVMCCATGEHYFLIVRVGAM